MFLFTDVNEIKIDSYTGGNIGIYGFQMGLDLIGMLQTSIELYSLC